MLHIKLVHFFVPALMILAGILLKRQPAHAGNRWGNRRAARYREAAAPEILLAMGVVTAAVAVWVNLLALSPAFRMAGTDGVAFGAEGAAILTAMALVRYNLMEEKQKTPVLPSAPHGSRRKKP